MYLFSLNYITSSTPLLIESKATLHPSHVQHSQVQLLITSFDLLVIWQLFSTPGVLAVSLLAC